jgi:hypothetical protein
VVVEGKIYPKARAGHTDHCCGGDGAAVVVSLLRRLGVAVDWTALRPGVVIRR